MNKETALLLAISTGDEDRVWDLLYDPELDVNAILPRDLVIVDPEDDVDDLPLPTITVLQFAAMQGDYAIVDHLLAHPNIDVNQTDESGNTALHLAAVEGHDHIVRLLLDDDRVIPDFLNGFNQTPLYAAATSGAMECVEEFLVTENTFDLSHQVDLIVFKPTFVEMLEMFLESDKDLMEIVNLLKRYQADPKTVRKELQDKMGVTQWKVAELYAQVIFISDGLLKPNIRTREGRFFALAERLPMELQMLLCNRAFALPKDSVTYKYSEPAFRHLAIVC